MKDILINYPIKFLQQELINVRTGYRLEKKRITEILKSMKSIKKLEKEQIIDLLIKYNYDISKLPKLEDLEKPKKPRAEPKEKKPRGQPKAKKEIEPVISTGKNQSLSRADLEAMKNKSQTKKTKSAQTIQRLVRSKKTNKSVKNYENEDWYKWNMERFKSGEEEQIDKYYSQYKNKRTISKEQKKKILEQIKAKVKTALDLAINKFLEDIKTEDGVRQYKELYSIFGDGEDDDIPDTIEYKIGQKKQEPPKVENPPAKVEEALDKVEKIEPILLNNKNVRLSTDDIIKFRSDIKIEPEKTIRELFNRKLTLENILSILDIGKTEIKFFNAFFTPMKEVDKLIDMSGIQFDNKKPIKILETSAGIGNIIIRLFNRDFNNKYNYKVDCYELNKYFYYIGKVIFENIKNVKWYNKDFLKEDIQTKYNYVFTNPPFNIKLDGKTYYDVDFLNKSYSLLEDGGRLCAIISVGYKSNSKNSTYKKFNESLKKIMDIDNSFVKTEEIQGFKEGDAGTTKEMKTGVNMVIMTIVKVPNLTLL
ncbi:MAG: hypothetical protein EBV32_02055 [Proteobacteria bacterium]|uniref:Methyltransferase small domain-containing protein n=1 Tax=Candidatus Fonsibacter lacus TaxID=2576439 RepID=A0A964XQD4_9PROT|nr:hypothetical protein [Candidatus Fonsibacter lacus]NBP59669.1 hypothetical protein [Pseudomonadota bacterium]NCU71857.1 hypothetical protein [Candidatus Fonsibacter lacus]